MNIRLEEIVVCASLGDNPGVGSSRLDESVAAFKRRGEVIGTGIVQIQGVKLVRMDAQSLVGHLSGQYSDLVALLAQEVDRVPTNQPGSTEYGDLHFFFGAHDESAIPKL